MEKGNHVSEEQETLETVKAEIARLPKMDVMRVLNLSDEIKAVMRKDLRFGLIALALVGAEIAAQPLEEEVHV